MQMLEQSLQSILFQKQNFQLELSETDSALKEIEKSDDNIFKIIGQLMIKSDKSKIKEELSNKKKLLETRIKSLEKQENSFTEKLEELRKKILGNK